ncbi:MAG: GAF domain-containing protein [Bacteroidetes bacterium]|nr:GAF domain-containing protein [Bacteroidota bacterium]
MHELRIELNSNKEETYKSLLPQIDALVSGEQDLIANLANISAALKSAFNWWWVGFYLVRQNELLLGPFQGPVACTRIAFGKGVCGSAWQQAQTIIVADVEKFPGHIVCSSSSKSEIVVPIIINNQVIGVLDVDSENLNHFDETDQLYLEELINLVQYIFKR